MGHALFSGAREGVQDREEKLTAILHKDVMKGGIDSIAR